MNQVNFFNSIAKDWDNIIKVDETKINYLLSQIDIKEDDYILDVGTGTGVLIPFLAKLSPKGSIKAVDISCNMLDIARNKFDDINNIEFTLLNVETDNLDEKLNVLVVSKSNLKNTNTYLAQGGISTARNNNDIELFIEDTLKAGQHKNKIDSVDGLLKFNMEGYTYNDELSNGEVTTFTRKNI